MTAVACAGLISALKSAAAGAVLVLSGACPATTVSGIAAPGVTLDLTAATFPSLAIYNSSGINLKGGVYGPSINAAVIIEGDSNVVVTAPHCVGAGTACVLVYRSTHVEVAGGASEASKGDGVDIAGSSFVHIHDFVCSGNIVTALHPDCVQGWSIPATASAPIVPLTDTEIDHNTAVGPTQGFDVFDHMPAPASQRINIHDNLAIITYPDCVSLTNSTDSQVANNRCVAYPGALWAPKLDIQGGVNVAVSGNTPS